MDYSGFPFPETTRTIVNALTFAKSKIQEYYESQKRTIDKTHWEIIDAALQTELLEIDAIVTFLQEHMMLSWTMDQKEYDRIHFAIRSALDIYIADMRQTKIQTNLGSFDKLIEEAEEVRKIQAISRTKTGKFDRYYYSSEKMPSADYKTAKVTIAAQYLVFIAYDDVTGYDFAEHLKRALEKRHISAFVAKKDNPPDIKRGEGWRQKIDPVIETCNTFILILSTDTLSSEVTRETKLAFNRNKNDPKFSIIIGHLKETPRTNEQLLLAGIDSQEYQQLDFDTQYGLAREITSRLDQSGNPKKPHSEVITDYEVADPSGDLVIGQIGLYLLAYSWFITWVLGQGLLFGLGLLAISSIIILIVGHAKRWSTDRVVPFCRRVFPIFLIVSIWCLSSSLGLEYGLSQYPTISGLLFETYLVNAPRYSLCLFLATVAGGVLLDLPRLSFGEMKSLYHWIRVRKQPFTHWIAVALLLTVIFANVASVDSNLALFTPKVSFVETRYLIDQQYHIYQIGLATFGAWSENEKIVHITVPLFPLITESSYSFVTNSTAQPPSTYPTTPLSILSSSGIAASTPVEDSQDRIVIGLATDSTSTTGAQFSVNFYSEYVVKTLAYIYLSPGIFIQNFKNGTQQLERRFVVVNHSAYELVLNQVILYQNGYTPENVSLTFYPKTFPWPNYYFNNSTGTFYLSQRVAANGNFTAVVIYNSS